MVRGKYMKNRMIRSLKRYGIGYSAFTVVNYILLTFVALIMLIPYLHVMAKAFNENDVPVFLISLRAGGTGLNLVGADMVIHFDPSSPNALAFAG